MINGLADLEGANRSELLGSLSKAVFERRTVIGCEAFSLSVDVDADNFILLSFFSCIQAIFPEMWTKQPPKNAEVQFQLPSIAQKHLCLTPFPIQNRCSPGASGQFQKPSV